MPVEIWSRFMRDAHQGVPIAALPSAPSGGLLSGLFGGGAQAPSSAPVPPASVQPAAAGPQQTTGSASLDGWLINNLFGRSRN
jgi:penicillin-binding protein 1A